MSVDLTPFGFTPTESAAYGALLQLGPSGGYALARELGIARANGYQALDGLVTKGVAELVEEQPKRYRAMRPTDLVALFSERQSKRLDRLEEQVRESPPGEGDTIVPITGLRALRDLVTRTTVRAAGAVTVLGPSDFLKSLAPALRARSAAGGGVHLWAIGTIPDLPAQIEGAIDASVVTPFFDQPPVIVTSLDGAVIAAISSDDARGFWISDPVLGASIRACLEALTASG